LPFPDPEKYVEKIKTFKETLDTKFLTLFNQSCLWKEEGKDFFLRIIS